MQLNHAANVTDAKSFHRFKGDDANSQEKRIYQRFVDKSKTASLTQQSPSALTFWRPKAYCGKNNYNTIMLLYWSLCVCSQLPSQTEGQMGLDQTQHGHSCVCLPCSCDTWNHMSKLPCLMGRREVKDGSGMEGCSEAKHQLLVCPCYLCLACS